MIYTGHWLGCPGKEAVSPIAGAGVGWGGVEWKGACEPCLRHLLGGFQAPVPGVGATVCGLMPFSARSQGGVGHRTWGEPEGCRSLANGKEVQWKEEDPCGVWVFLGSAGGTIPLCPTLEWSPSCWEGFQWTAGEGYLTNGGKQGNSLGHRAKSQV